MKRRVPVACVRFSTMSALGHKQTFYDAGAMSALPPIADIDRGEETLWATCDQRGFSGPNVTAIV